MIVAIIILVIILASFLSGCKIIASQYDED